ncbi:unnamed protein product [Caenorhabditis auriculariae]|uniref:EGF-like domain-containing protein n=1 Tax=Caenorhabditis auriculariae TaxID=2777116 RepID=A0A8S1HWR0_9PELO|nr:unnamed protein product [Caenorhabditis auriculariae]
MLYSLVRIYPLGCFIWSTVSALNHTVVNVTESSTSSVETTDSTMTLSTESSKRTTTTARERSTTEYETEELTRYSMKSTNNADSDEITQHLADSYILDGYKVEFPKGDIMKIIDHCETNKPCDHGSCVLTDPGTPIQWFICECKYGYLGKTCDKKIPTKWKYSVLLTIVLLIVLGLTAFSFLTFNSRRYYESNQPRRRFVDVLGINSRATPRVPPNPNTATTSIRL